VSEASDRGTRERSPERTKGTVTGSQSERRVEGRRCSLARAVGTVGEFWSVLVVRDLWSYGPQRFDELQAGLGVSSNTLANRLARLTEHGVVARRLYQRAPDRYEYCLTAAGMDLVPALLALTAWGDRYLAGESGPAAVFRHHEAGQHGVGQLGAGQRGVGQREAGHRARPVVVCAECGEPLTLGNTYPEKGPGAAAGGRPYLGAPDPAAVHALCPSNS
jgi:DNA-binding HxlR family transcriptional regulator